MSKVEKDINIVVDHKYSNSLFTLFGLNSSAFKIIEKRSNQEDERYSFYASPSISDELIPPNAADVLKANQTFLCLLLTLTREI